MDQAAVWLAGSILFSLGLVAVVAGIVATNNIVSKYWKPVRIFTADSWNINPPHRFIHEDEQVKIAPELDSKAK